MQLSELADIMNKFGNSTELSRQTIIEQIGGLDKMHKLADQWYNHNSKHGTFVLFATAIDLGFRIARVNKK